MRCRAVVGLPRSWLIGECSVALRGQFQRDEKAQLRICGCPVIQLKPLPRPILGLYPSSFFRTFTLFSRRRRGVKELQGGWGV